MAAVPDTHPAQASQPSTCSPAGTWTPTLGRHRHGGTRAHTEHTGTHAQAGAHGDTRTQRHICTRKDSLVRFRDSHTGCLEAVTPQDTVHPQGLMNTQPLVCSQAQGCRDTRHTHRHTEMSKPALMRTQAQKRQTHPETPGTQPSSREHSFLLLPRPALLQSVSRTPTGPPAPTRPPAAQVLTSATSLGAGTTVETPTLSQPAVWHRCRAG